MSAGIGRVLGPILSEPTAIKFLVWFCAAMVVTSIMNSFSVSLLFLIEVLVEFMAIWQTQSNFLETWVGNL